ncbi:MAG TPA: hypothetical protein VFO19_21625 [Vicinamibacterales bacterium]|nr:hypothetical protein [Vicinamibacterales bacterium]
MSAALDTDVNAVVGGYLRDLAFAQSSKRKQFGYKRAAAIFAPDAPLTELLQPDGSLPRIKGIGPGSTRVILEVLHSGTLPTVEQAVAGSESRGEIDRRRSLRRHYLSRAAVRAILSDASLSGPTLEQYRGDLQMHSEWSDGSPTVGEIANACIARGYLYAAVTDHSYGLRIAGGISMAEAADHVIAARALAAGCIFALDSDAHTIDQLWYAEIAIAHARLAAIPPDRIVNCWPRERLESWLRDPPSVR